VTDTPTHTQTNTGPWHIYRAEHSSRGKNGATNASHPTDEIVLKIRLNETDFTKIFTESTKIKIRLQLQLLNILSKLAWSYFTHNTLSTVQLLFTAVIRNDLCIKQFKHFTTYSNYVVNLVGLP